jgi:hypothetical protein
LQEELKAKHEVPSTDLFVNNLKAAIKQEAAADPAIDIDASNPAAFASILAATKTHNRALGALGPPARQVVEEKRQLLASAGKKVSALLLFGCDCQVLALIPLCFSAKL